MKFRTALVVGIAALLALVIAALLGGISRVVGSYAQESVARDLTRSRQTVRELWQLHQAVYRAEGQRLAEDPRLRAVAATSDIDTETVVDVASDVSRAIAADLFLLVDEAGVLMADTQHPEAAGQSLSHLPLVRETLEKGQAGGLWTSGALLYQVQATSMRFGQTTVGAILVGRRVDRRLADSLREQTGAETLLLLAQQSIAGSAHAPQLSARQLVSLAGNDAQSSQLSVAGSEFVASSLVLGQTSDGRALRVVLLGSLAAATELARRLSQVVSLVAGFALLAAIVLAVLLARRLSGPLDELVRVVGQLGQGDLTARAHGSSMHETRTLAKAMNQMASELSESRQQIEVKQRLEREMEIANVLQTSMLPRGLRAAQLDIAARMVPASEVGGDYYDVIPAGDSCWIGVGDVSGHGLPAGIVMMMMQTALTALVAEQPDRNPASAVIALNRLIYHNVRDRLQASEHATFTLLRHDGDGRFRHAGAHESILIYRQATGRWQRERTSGTWLALVEDVSSCTHDSALQLAPGDAMLLYTDGLTEAQSSAGELFGIERLEAALGALGPLAQHSAEQILSRVFAVCAAWGPVQDDDRTALLVRYTGTREARR